jgi:hypothetical protein
VTSDLLNQLEAYGRQLDDETPPLLPVPPAVPSRKRRTLFRRPWAVAAAAAVAVVVLIGGAALLLRGEPAEPANQAPGIPETWTTYTAAADGIVSECLCRMEMATDGSIWIVGWDGISRFDGTQWERIQPPRPFSGEGWPAVAPAPDGSVWILGMSYVARYVEGTWDPIVEAGYQDDGGPLVFQGLWIDDDDRAWTSLADEPGVIRDGVFTPMATPEEVVVTIPGLADPPGGLMAIDPAGSYWMSIGDTFSGVAGALIEYHEGKLTYHALGGVRDAVFDESGVGWFLVHQVGDDAWMFGQEQWSEPGLYRLEGDDWYRITTADGLAGYRFTAMVQAADGALWLSTADGTVTRYQPGSDPQSGTLVHIDSRPFSETDRPPPDGGYPPTTVPSG